MQTDITTTITIITRLVNQYGTKYQHNECELC